MDMRAYEVEMIRDGKVKYFFIRNMETMEIELLPTRFLTHKTRAQESPNTVGSLARSICYYMNFCDGRQMGFTDVCQMDYEAQFNHFTDFLQWLKAGNHTKNLKKTPRNRTCNTYLKNVFGFFSFLEMAEDQFGPLQVLSYGTIHVANSVGVKRRLRFRSFAGYLKEEEREVRAAEKNEIVTILEACTNCRDQLLILMASELGFRIGELLGIDYTKDIDYENHSVRVCFRDDNANDARAKNAEERKGRQCRQQSKQIKKMISCYFIFRNTGTSFGVRITCLSILQVKQKESRCRWQAYMICSIEWKKRQELRSRLTC